MDYQKMRVNSYNTDLSVAMGYFDPGGIKLQHITNGTHSNEYILLYY
jgi:hypothetical protein